MAQSNKLAITIYEIEREQFEKLNEEETIEEIIRRLKEAGSDIREIPLKEDIDDDFIVRLYNIYKYYPPTWLKFIAPKISGDAQILQQCNHVFSFIGFFGYNDRIYAIAGGYGSFEIEQFTKHDFGLGIVVKIFEKDSRVIKSLQQRAVTGIVMGQSKFYRGDQRFSDENEFGQIFKQLQAELDRVLLVNVFGFSEDDLRKEKSGCLAKSSFKINKAISFDELLALIRKIDSILKLEDKFTLNKVIHLKGKRYESLTKELDEEMFVQIYQDYLTGKTPDFEICNANFEQYLTAEKYIIPLDSKKNIELDHRPNWRTIIRNLSDHHAIISDDQALFKHSVLMRRLESYNENEIRLTHDSIYDHLNGELQYNGRTYFHIDKGWYKVDPTFIDDLNKQCINLLKDAWAPNIIAKKFDITKDEDVFNQLYLNHPNTLVLDTITPENIECCDILFYENNNITLVHVKKGFRNTIRDLAAQISISAKRVRDALASNDTYFDKVEAMAKKSVKKDDLRKAIAAQTFPVQGLTKLFNQIPRPSITFCLAFVDTVDKKRSINTQIEEFGSNIAKYSLIELGEELRKMNYQFKIVQIQKA